MATHTDKIVDGGHRAIKYSRLHGIRSDIYPEGTHLVVRIRLLHSSLLILHPHCYQNDQC